MEFLQNMLFQSCQATTKTVCNNIYDIIEKNIKITSKYSEIEECNGKPETNA